ncbi:MAG: bifunctional oligoribonuclease/PAP phosphatase NrnA [Coriobacteriia bacterium]|nr:bifunctional oligoribonuclease/PAP phosphatase NrnA [Coriobacteriia bacterium]
MQLHSIEKIKDKLQDYDNYVICGHVNPDADCIGSQIALNLLLKSISKKTTMLLNGNLEECFKFLPDSDKFTEKIPEDDYAFIYVDVAEDKRLNIKGASNKATVKFVFDHHQVNNADVDYAYIDSDIASTSMLIWQLAKSLNITNKDIATACLCGLMGDTGSFRYQNADADAYSSALEMVKAGASSSEIALNLYQKRSIESFKIEEQVLNNLYIDSEHKFALSCIDADTFEKYNATKADTEGMVDLIRSLGCVDVACLLRQTEKKKKVHGSIRSKTDIDVSVLATKHNGGGHKAAAGFTMNETNLETAFKTIKNDMVKLMS